METSFEAFNMRKKSAQHLDETYSKLNSLHMKQSCRVKIEITKTQKSS